MKIAKLNIEGYIGGADLTSLFGGEETFSLSKLKKFLDSLEADVTDIHVYINSGGGSVVEGWAIYDKLKTSGKTITTIGEGMVGSIATIIYMAGSTRKLHENSRFFIHNPYWQPDAPIPMEGDALINLGEDLKKEQTKILDFYAIQTGTDLETIKPLMQRATDLTSIEAVNMGFATEIISTSVNYHAYKLVAYVDAKKVEPIIKKQKMENKMNDSWISRKLTKLAALINGVTLNMEMPVTDESGASVVLFIESETEDLTGKPAFIIDAEGNQVVAPNGKYADADGKVIVVVDGMVSEVIDAEEKAPEANATLDELNAKIAELETMKASLSTELESVKAEKESAAVTFAAFKAEFETLKSVVIGKNEKFAASKQEFKGNDKPTGSANPFMDELAASLSKKK